MNTFIIWSQIYALLRYLVSQGTYNYVILTKGFDRKGLALPSISISLYVRKQNSPVLYVYIFYHPLDVHAPIGRRSSNSWCMIVQQLIDNESLCFFHLIDKEKSPRLSLSKPLPLRRNSNSRKIYGNNWYAQIGYGN